MVQMDGAVTGMFDKLDEEKIYIYLLKRFSLKICMKYILKIYTYKFGPSRKILRPRDSTWVKQLNFHYEQFFSEKT